MAAELNRIASFTEFNGIALFEDYDQTVFDSVSLAGVDGTSAQNAIEIVAAAIDQNNSERTLVGSDINSQERNIAMLDIQTENLTAAESRISDVDVATEMAKLVKSQVMVQASISMIAAANDMSKLVLKLLE